VNTTEEKPTLSVARDTLISVIRAREEMLDRPDRYAALLSRRRSSPAKDFTWQVFSIEPGVVCPFLMLSSGSWVTSSSQRVTSTAVDAASATTLAAAAVPNALPPSRCSACSGLGRWWAQAVPASLEPLRPRALTRRSETTQQALGRL
jgi:hypothetical protein